MKTGNVMLAVLVLLASVTSVAAQSRGGYRPPPPPPPMPRPSAPAAPPPRMASPPPSRSQALAPSGPASRVPRPSGPATTAKGGTTQKTPDYARMNPSELQKAIGSHTKQIETYRAKVSNPSANHPNWSSLSREQQGALMRQWNDAIRRNETSRASAQRMLSQRAAR